MFLSESLSFLDRLGLGGMTALIGIAMVFLVLGLLIGVINLLKLAIQHMPAFIKYVKSKFTVLAKSKKETVKPITTKKEENITKIIVSDENDEEIAACISGAISYILATEQNITVNQAKARFIVKSIKRN